MFFLNLCLLNFVIVNLMMQVFVTISLFNFKIRFIMTRFFSGDNYSR